MATEQDFLKKLIEHLIIAYTEPNTDQEREIHDKSRRVLRMYSQMLMLQEKIKADEKKESELSRELDKEF